MTGRLNRKTAAAIGAVGVGLLGLAALRHPARTPPRPVKLLFAYPVTHLEPTLYDDWETVFIGNHIYPRLLPEDHNPAIPAVTANVAVACDEPAAADVGPSCRRVRLSFAVRPFKDCAGHSYDADEIRDEFEQLLDAKSWALPGWKRCAASPGTVCVTGMNTGDIARRLKDVNFRFGWSKHAKGDHVFGAGPYCLIAAPGPQGTITAGRLAPRDPMSRLPEIAFSTEGGKDAVFDVALYGSKDLLQGARRNVQADTPLAFYVVTNPLLAGRQLPWNSKRTRDTIHDHFVRQGVFFDRSPDIEKLVPAGGALAGRGAETVEGRPNDFAIPDYLPGCRALAKALTAGWRGAARARCVDIVAYVQRRVRERRGPWSAFLVGLSPADPGREAIKLQYFSTGSKDSLTYDYAKPDDLYYLAGIGQSLVTVDGRNVCGLNPNPLGLGNVFITDFLRCTR